MAKTKFPMSLSMEPEFAATLKKHAHKRGMHVSELIRDILKQCLVDEDETIPIMLKIPSKLRTDSAGLSNWLNVRIPGLVAAICKAED